MNVLMRLLPSPLVRLLLFFLLTLVLASAGVSPEGLPNLILILADDQGYAELGCFGSGKSTTPRIDRMAEEGVRLTSFYAAPACGPARASLLTGCYPNRVGLGFNNPIPQSPDEAFGLALSEITIAEVLQEKGYTSAIIGKWHMGEREFLPGHQGFDSFFGLPWSHGLYGPAAEPATAFLNPPYYPRTPLYLNNEPIEFDPDISLLTARYTDRALQFIRDNRKKPFFLYLAHSMIHTPLAARPSFSKHFPDPRDAAIRELDWSTGEILDTLAELGLEEKTLVIYTSDNGRPGPNNAPLRAGKGSVFEGGVRVPFVARWPGKIPPGLVRSEIASLMDILPTFAHLAGSELPSDRVIDGKNIWALLAGKDIGPSHQVFYYQFQDTLLAVRSGPWKLFVEGSVPLGEQMSVYEPALYNLDNDIGESHNLIREYPDLVLRLRGMIDRLRVDIKEHGRPIGVGTATLPHASSSE